MRLLLEQPASSGICRDQQNLSTWAGRKKRDDMQTSPSETRGALQFVAQLLPTTAASPESSNPCPIAPLWNAH